MVISLAKISIARGFVSALLGLLIATVGLDYMVPLPRFTFGSVSLLAGLPIVPVLIGIFAFAQVFHMIEEESASYFDIGLKKQMITLKEFKEIFRTLIRSSIIGTLVGIIPAAGPNIAAFFGYSEAKRNSQHPERFGTGEIEGIASSEAANNAVPAGALVPLLVFGIPGDTVTAILLGAFILQGIQPGPLLFVENLDLVYPIFVMFRLGSKTIMVNSKAVKKMRMRSTNLVPQT